MMKIRASSNRNLTSLGQKGKRGNLRKKMWKGSEQVQRCDLLCEEAPVEGGGRYVSDLTAPPAFDQVNYPEHSVQDLIGS